MEVRINRGLDLSPEAADIRKTVFVDEQGFQKEFDDIDKDAYHAVVFTDDKIPAACGRLFTSDGKAYTIGRVAVLKEYHKKGLGEKIVKALENKARELGGIETELSAQLRARGFYEKLGYFPYGDEYLDEYCPHISMKKAL